MRKLLLILALFSPALLSAQTPARFDLPVLTTTPATTPPGNQPPLYAVINATVNVCGYPATMSGGVCTNKVTTYTGSTLSTACPATAQLTAPGSATCISTTGLQGALGFWYDAATQTHMTYTVSTSWGNFGPYDIDPGGGAGLPVQPGQIQGGTTGQVLTKVGASPEWADPTCATATSSTLGCSRPDNTSVIINSGILSAIVSGGFQNYTPDPLGTQSVLVTATSFTIDNDGDPIKCPVSGSNTSGVVQAIGPQGNLDCLALPGPSITWTGFTLPSYVLPANVTAVYPVSKNGFSGGALNAVVKCSVAGNSVNVSPNAGVQAYWPMQSLSGLLTGATGANIASVSCVAGFSNNGLADGGIDAMNIPYIAMRVYYTGTAPPASDLLNLTAPLYINPALNSMGVAAINLGGSGDGGVVGLLPAANLAPPTQTTLNGTTAGAAVWVETAQFGTWKHAAIYLNGYENTTATAQTITLPAGFGTVSAVLTDTGAGTCAGVTVSGATVTLPASMAAPQTGLCEIRGW